MHVSEIMRRTIISVSPETRVQDARWIASEKGIRHLVVVSRRALVGVVCMCDLEKLDEQDPVGHALGREVESATPSTDAREAAHRMRTLKIGCLPVLAEGQLLGILTRSDLRRAGLSDEEVFGDRRCVVCGSHHELGEDPRGSELSLCRACLDRAYVDLEDTELGGGD